MSARVFIATIPPRLSARADPDIVWLDVCGRSVSRGLTDVWFPLWQSKIIFALIAAQPKLLSLRDVADTAWGEDENGGPLNPRNKIWIALCHAKPRLALLGIHIEGVHGQGWRAVTSELPQEQRRAA